jgi:hypothetical protein
MKSLRNSRVRRRDFIAFVGSASIASRLASSTAVAQRYPSRPITLVIPFPPGGGNDALGRMVADKMSKSIGQQIVVTIAVGRGELLPHEQLREVHPTGTPFYSLIPERSPSIRASTPIRGMIRARISLRSA